MTNRILCAAARALEKAGLRCAAAQVHPALCPLRWAARITRISLAEARRKYWYLCGIEVRKRCKT